jgi:hypothetical protein
MGPLPEERSKATGVSSLNTQKWAVKLPSTVVKLPASVCQQPDCMPGWSDRHHLELSPRPYFGYTQMCSCNGGEAFSINTLFDDSDGENLWL